MCVNTCTATTVWCDSVSSRRGQLSTRRPPISVKARLSLPWIYCFGHFNMWTTNWKSRECHFFPFMIAMAFIPQHSSPSPSSLSLPPASIPAHPPFFSSPFAGMDLWNVSRVCWYGLSKSHGDIREIEATVNSEDRPCAVISFCLLSCDVQVAYNNWKYSTS